MRLLTAEQLQDAIGYVTGSVKTVEQAAAVVDESRRELERVREDLRTKRPAWEAGLVERLKKATWWDGSWWSAGVFTAKTPELAHSTDFGPETSLDRFDAPGALSGRTRSAGSPSGWNVENSQPAQGARQAMYPWHVVHARPRPGSDAGCG
ncbi:MAG: hypothetical protein CM1200mP2_55420 [Planctomycetaceae bacterium]|nr:MAG: hypothetical protein CM1200mP2_55420 [Planctomycetaceae bacterium]